MERHRGEPRFRGEGDNKHLPVTRRKYSFKKASFLKPTHEAIAACKERNGGELPQRTRIPAKERLFRGM